MHATSRNALIITAAACIAGTVFWLGQQNRALRTRNSRLIAQFSQPHPGLIVPAFTAAVVGGDSVTIGAAPDDRRQVLFFLSTTCEYCVSSLPAIVALDSALARTAGAHDRVYLVAVDSPPAVRHFADSARLATPVALLPGRRIALLYRVRAVPQLLVVDSGGRTLYARAGELRAGSALDSVLAAVTRRPARAPAATSLVAPER